MIHDHYKLYRNGSRWDAFVFTMWWVAERRCPDDSSFSPLVGLVNLFSTYSFIRDSSLIIDRHIVIL
jgi:hypothetical protein